MTQAPAFSFDTYELDPARALLVCRYSLGPHRFEERFTFASDGEWDAPGVDEAARLLFLLAGVSYYKTAAPTLVRIGIPTTEGERSFLTSFLIEGLGEFAYRNGLDLSDLRVEGPSRSAHSARIALVDRPLVPFGGGIDSIVTTESVRASHPDTALFVASRPGDRFEAIERPAAVSGLPIVRVEREIDPALLRSAELGFLNGHVPVTGILSAAGILAALLAGRDTLVMSNEWSSSVPNLVSANGRAVNHQYSKSADFESTLSNLLAEVLPGFRYFSLLRPFSELWVASRFAQLVPYHGVFRSCNRAFHIDPAARLDHWCATCDKCCFIDLILSPYLDVRALDAIFDGAEPLTNLELRPTFETLIGLSEDDKPFECVGDPDECSAAIVLASQRPDRANAGLVQSLAKERAAAGPLPRVERLLGPLSAHAVPDAYAPHDQLV